MKIRAMLLVSLLMMPLLTLSQAEAQTPGTLWALMGRDSVPTFHTLRGEIRLATAVLELPDASPAPTVTISLFSADMPNRIHLQIVSPTPDGDGILMCDGVQLTLVSHILGQVARRPAPDSLQEIGPEDLALVGHGGVLLRGILGMDHPLLHRLTGDPNVSAQALELSEHRGVLCETSMIETHSGGAVERLTVAFDPGSGFPVWLEIEQTSSQGTPWLRITEEFTELEIDGGLPANAFTVEIPDGLAEVPALDPTAPVERSAQSAR